MFLVLRLYWVFLKSFFTALSGGHSALAIAWTSWTQSHTYRIIGSNAAKDPLAFFRYWLRSIKKIWKEGRSINPVDGIESNGVIAYYQEQWQTDHYLPYLQRLVHRPISGILLREEMGLKGHLPAKLLISLLLLTFSVILFPFFLFSKKKGATALMQLQFVENLMLTCILKNQGVEYVYFFGGFENDANLTAVFLQVAGIKLHKVPSSNPIKNFYAKVVSDAFSFTAPFQQEEYLHLQKNWFVEKTVLWPIFNFTRLMPFIAANFHAPARNTIGFLSRGMWLRKERGDSFLGVGEDVAEYEAMNALKEYLLKHTDVTLWIFTHPIERKTPELYAKANAYYRSYFDGCKVSLPPADKSSYELFHTVDLALASVSSSNMERLFCGYKTLYAPIGLTIDLFEGTAVDKIVCKTGASLVIKIEESLQFSTDEFFANNGLKGYRYLDYPELMHGK
jgi:hypothetical protein